MSAKKVKPFITAPNRFDLVANLSRQHQDTVAKTVAQLIERGLNANIPKKDGKDGGKDSGEGGFWDKKDGKEGKEKDKDGKDGGKDGKEKEGKEEKDGKESKDGKEDKDGKEGGKDSKDGKEDNKDGKDGKDGKDDSDGDKIGGSEGDQVFRYGDEAILQAGQFSVIAEIHSARLAALLNQSIF